MKIVVLLLAIMAFVLDAAEPSLPQAWEETRLHEENFFSRALNKEHSYTVLLPEGYRKTTPYPVV